MEVVQATPLNQRGSLASLTQLRQQRKAQRRPGISIFGDLVWQINHLHDNPCGTAALALAIKLGRRGLDHIIEFVIYAM